MPKHTEALCAAIAWAKQNPDKITSGTLARNAEGFSVSTLSPNATCFCILGIAARMACQDTTSTSDILNYFELPANVYVENDEGIHYKNPTRGAQYLETLVECN